MGTFRSPFRSPFRPITRAITEAGVGGFNPALQADYFVASDGSDSNDGLTPATPKLTVQAVTALFNADSGDKTVYVAPGTYKGGPYFNGADGAYSSRRHITYYMSGVTIDNQDDAAGNFQNVVFSNSKNLTLEVVGPCVLTNSANDIVNADSASVDGSQPIIIIRNVTTTNPGAAGDGFSCHANSVGYAYDCTFTTDADKSAIAHIDVTRTYHYRCVINVLSSASGSRVKVSATAVGSPQAYFEDCQFIAKGANVLLLSVNDSGANVGFARFTRCQFLLDGGTWNTSGANGVNSTIEMIDCYGEGWGTEPNAQSIVRGCYGDFRLSVGRGAGAGNCVIENNAFSRAASEIIQWTAFNGTTHAGGPGGVIRNNIFLNTTTAAIRSVTTGGAIDAINSLWLFQNNCFYNNVLNYTAGLTADGVDVLANPMLVSGAGATQTNWYVQAGSPCIGAGTSGGNIGVGVAP